MQEPETCPKCNAEFPARKAIVSGGMRPVLYSMQDKGPVVKCPNCWHIFPPQNLRLLGFIPVQSHRRIIWAILAVCFVLAFIHHNSK